jgi:hypothetical protein
MTLRGILQIALGIVLWVGAVVALWFGMWIPLAVLGVLSLLVVAAFAGPGLLAGRSRNRRNSD